MLLPSSFADGVPDWIKNTAGWWADDQISEVEFVNAIEFLVNNGIIVVSDTKQSESGADGVPDWIKNTAGWWADDQISEVEFVNAIEFLINTNVMNIDIFNENKLSSLLLSWDEIVRDSKHANDGSLKIKNHFFSDSDIMLTTKYDSYNDVFQDVTTFDLMTSGINLFKITGDESYLTQAKDVANVIERDLLLENGQILLYSPITQQYQYVSQNQEILFGLAKLSLLDSKYSHLMSTIATRILENEINTETNLFYSDFDSTGNFLSTEMYLSYQGSEALESLLLAYEVTNDQKYLKQVKKTLLSYWGLRNLETNLIPSSVNADDSSIEKEFMQQYGAGIFLKILLHYYYLTDDPEILVIMETYADAVIENFWDGKTWDYRVNLNGEIFSSVIEANYAKLDDALILLHDLNPEKFKNYLYYAKMNYDNSFQNKIYTKNNLVVHSVKDDGSKESKESMMQYAFLINQNVGSRLFYETNDTEYLKLLNEFYHSVIMNHKTNLGYVVAVDAYTLENTDLSHMLNQRATGMISNKINLTFMPIGDVEIIWMKIGNHELTEPFITTFHDPGRFNSIDFNYDDKSILFHTIYNQGEIIFSDEIKSVFVDGIEYFDFNYNVLATIDGTHNYHVFFK